MIGKTGSGKSDYVSILGVGLMVFSLAAVVAVIANPQIRLLFSPKSLATDYCTPRGLVTLPDGSCGPAPAPVTPPQGAVITVTNTNDSSYLCQTGCSDGAILLAGQANARIGYQYTNGSGDIAGFYQYNNRYYPIGQSAGGPTANDLAGLSKTIAAQKTAGSDPNALRALIALNPTVAKATEAAITTQCQTDNAGGSKFQCTTEAGLLDYLQAQQTDAKQLLARVNSAPNGTYTQSQLNSYLATLKTYLDRNVITLDQYNQAVNEAGIAAARAQAAADAATQAKAAADAALAAQQKSLSVIASGNTNAADLKVVTALCNADKAAGKTTRDCGLAFDIQQYSLDILKTANLPLYQQSVTAGQTLTQKMAACINNGQTWSNATSTCGGASSLAQLTAPSNASCGSGMIAEGTVCRNPSTGKIVDYNNIAYYNLLTSTVTSADTSSKNSTYSQVQAFCKQVPGAICNTVQDVLNFSASQLSNQTQDPSLLSQAVDVNYIKAIQGDKTALATLQKANPTLYTQAQAQIKSTTDTAATQQKSLATIASGSMNSTDLQTVTALCNADKAAGKTTRDCGLAFDIQQYSLDALKTANLTLYQQSVTAGQTLTQKMAACINGGQTWSNATNTCSGAAPANTTTQQKTTQTTPASQNPQAFVDKVNSAIAQWERKLALTYTPPATTTVEKQPDGRFITNTTNTTYGRLTGNIINSNTVQTTAQTTSTFAQTPTGPVRTDITVTTDIATNKVVDTKTTTTQNLGTTIANLWYGFSTIKVSSVGNAIGNAIGNTANVVVDTVKSIPGAIGNFFTNIFNPAPSTTKTTTQTTSQVPTVQTQVPITPIVESQPVLNQSSSSLGQILTPAAPQVVLAAPITVPYQGYISVDQTPAVYKVISYYTQIFNEVFAERGMPVTQADKNAFVQAVLAKLKSSGISSAVDLTNDKTFIDYLTTRVNGDKMAAISFGNEELVQCNLWAIGVADILKATQNINIVADQYEFTDGNAFNLADTKPLNAQQTSCYTSMEGALDSTSCSGKNLQYNIQGDITAYRFTDYASINKGDSYTYKTGSNTGHFGVILDKYQVNGKYYFLVTEANSPKASGSQGAPETYIVSQDDFAARVNPLSNTYFLRLNKYNQGTTPATTPDTGILNVIESYKSTTVVPPTISEQNPVPPTSTSKIAGASYTTSPSGQQFLYWSQLDPAYSGTPIDIPGVNKKYNTWEQQGCGIMVGAMVTNLTPQQYYQDFTKSGNNFQIIPGTKGIPGTSYDQMKTTLNSLGYADPIVITKDQINSYASQGIPVVADTTMKVDGNWTPHLAEVIGVNTDGKYVLNDPSGGAGRLINDHDINQKGQSLTLYAVIPPANP